MQTFQLAQKGIWVSLCCYLMLSIGKIVIGLWSNSLAVLADGFNNTSDLFLSIVILISLRVASRPADRDHPFGHHKAESVAILITASFMALVSLHIWIDVITVWFTGQTATIHPLAFYVSILSAIVMFCVYLFNLHLSKKTNRQALKAAALDNRSDALVSLGAAIGIVGNRWGWEMVDSIAAFVVGVMIMKTAIDIGKPAVHTLMDRFDEEQLIHIRKRIHTVEGINKVKELRARNQGSAVLVELTVGVHPDLSVTQSHVITEKIEQQLLGFANIQHVHIHVEPNE